jgi:hypothetical protein
MGNVRNRDNEADEVALIFEGVDLGRYAVELLQVRHALTSGTDTAPAAPVVPTADPRCQKPVGFRIYGMRCRCDAVSSRNSFSLISFRDFWVTGKGESFSTASTFPRQGIRAKGSREIEADTWPAPGSPGHIRSPCPLLGREGQRDQLCLIGGSYAGIEDGSGDHIRSRRTREIERSYRSNEKCFHQAFLRQVGGSVSYREPSGYSPEHPVPDTSAPRPMGNLLPPGLAGRDSPLQYSGSGLPSCPRDQRAALLPLQGGGMLLID